MTRVECRNHLPWRAPWTTRAVCAIDPGGTWRDNRRPDRFVRYAIVRVCDRYAAWRGR